MLWKVTASKTRATRIKETKIVRKSWDFFLNSQILFIWKLVQHRKQQHHTRYFKVIWLRSCWKYSRTLNVCAIRPRLTIKNNNIFLQDQDWAGKQNARLPSKAILCSKIFLQEEMMYVHVRTRRTVGASKRNENRYSIAMRVCHLLSRETKGTDGTLSFFNQTNLHRIMMSGETCRSHSRIF